MPHKLQNGHFAAKTPRNSLQTTYDKYLLFLFHVIQITFVKIMRILDVLVVSFHEENETIHKDLGSLTNLDLNHVELVVRENLEKETHFGEGLQLFVQKRVDDSLQSGLRLLSFVCDHLTEPVNHEKEIR